MGRFAGPGQATAIGQGQCGANETTLLDFEAVGCSRDGRSIVRFDRGSGGRLSRFQLQLDKANAELVGIFALFQIVRTGGLGNMEFQSVSRRGEGEVQALGLILGGPRSAMRRFCSRRMPMAPKEAELRSAHTPSPA